MSRKHPDIAHFDKPGQASAFVTVSTGMRLASRMVECSCSAAMPSRGRHQSSSKECHLVMRRIEALDGVTGVIIGRSYGGKSLGKGIGTGAVKIQRKVSGGLKAVTQSEKGLQEIFIRTEPGMEDAIVESILKF